MTTVTLNPIASKFFNALERQALMISLNFIYDTDSIIEVTEEIFILTPTVMDRLKELENVGVEVFKVTSSRKEEMKVEQNKEDMKVEQNSIEIINQAAKNGDGSAVKLLLTNMISRI